MDKVRFFLLRLNHFAVIRIIPTCAMGSRLRKKSAGTSAEKRAKIHAEKLQKNVQKILHEFCV